MKNDNFVNSKIYSFFEFLYRMIILNLVTILGILFGLGVFSLMVSLISLVIIVRSLNSETDFPLVKTYLNAFKKNYWSVLKLSFFYFLLGLILIFNTYFFYLALIQINGFINEIFFYIALILDGIFLISFINACYIYVYFPNLSNLKIIKYSFILQRAIPLKAIIILILFAGMIYLFYIIPILALFIGLSFFIYMVNLLLRKPYSILVADGVETLEASMYVKKN